jgi:Flp pilus assembly pilin Flp
MQYYRDYMPDNKGASPIRFGLIAAAVAVVVIRSVQLMGFDLSSTLDTFKTVLQ